MINGEGWQRIAVSVFVLMIMVGAVVTGVFLIRQEQDVRIGAWDCSRYVFEIREDGSVVALNGSTRDEPEQKADVFINDELVNTFDVPKLDKGDAATIGSVDIPDSFSWKVVGSRDCESSGNIEIEKKIKICHATGIESNPYVEITVPENSDHHDEHKGHSGDIILEEGQSCPEPEPSPSPSPSVEPSPSPTAPPTGCPLDGSGGILVDFGTQRLRADRDEAKAKSGPYTANIPAGTYKITLAASDEGHATSTQNQKQEIYFLDLLNSSGQTVANSGKSDDIPEDIVTNTTVVDTGLRIGQDITSIVTRHGYYPDSSNPQSVNVECALFEEVPEPIIAQCLDIKTFDDEWNLLSSSDYQNLRVGDVIRFSIGASATQGSFNKARFTVNGATMADVTNRRPGTNEFYHEFVIEEGLEELRVLGEVHHDTLGWF